MNLNKIVAPASKSYLQRALAISALAVGKTELKNVSFCDDVIAAKEIIEALGVETDSKDRTLSIKSNKIVFDQQRYSAKEAGLSIRMFSPILAMGDQLLTFSGTGSLLKRPMQSIVDALEQLSVKVESNDGLLPLQIQGQIQAGTIDIDGALSSQLLTGLLISLPVLEGDSIINVKNLKSKPYIDMTLDIMKAFSVEVEHDNYKVFKIKGQQKYKPSIYNIEGDWSAASFFLVLAAVKGEVQVENLDPNTKQADRAILNVLKEVGANIEIQNQSVKLSPGQLKAFEFDATHCPDLFPPLVVLASQCNGVSQIKGVNRLIHKESNRAEVLKQEFEKIGVSIELVADIMKITPGLIKDGIIDSNNDHRIAMAAGVLSLLTEKKIQILNKEAIHKSYPDFFTELYKLRF